MFCFYIQSSLIGFIRVPLNKTQCFDCFRSKSVKPTCVYLIMNPAACEGLRGLLKTNGVSSIIIVCTKLILYREKNLIGKISCPVFIKSVSLLDLRSVYIQAIIFLFETTHGKKKTVFLYIHNKTLRADNVTTINEADSRCNTEGASILPIKLHFHPLRFSPLTV